MNAAGHIRSGMASPTQVQAYAGRTLDLLQAIEKTVDYLVENRDLIRVLSVGISDALEKLQAESIEVPLDPEGRVCELFSGCLDAIARMHHNSQRRRAAAAADGRLRHDDGVVEAYDAFIAALNDAHQDVHDLKDWIETHDALLEQPVGGAFVDVDDLFLAIGVTAK